MQDPREHPPLELELERVPKFSILDCIRSEVKDIVNKLPRKSGDRLRQEIDSVIRKNLLRERKVRFVSAKEAKEEPEKNALEEIEMTLQVLGNDRNNKLIIENFGLLEERIKRVEQRLSGLLRRIPDIDQTSRPTVKIDPKRVKSNIQEFVNMFNSVFTSTYEVLTNHNTNMSIMDETLSSKNRLKFHLLSHLSELKGSNEGDKKSLSKKCIGSSGSAKNAQIANGTGTKTAKGKLGQYQKMESKIEVPSIKAVDSLITLRQRFRAQSAKWKQLKLNRKIQEADEKAKKFQAKNCIDLYSRKRDDPKTTKKAKEIALNEQSLHSSSLDDDSYVNMMQDLYDFGRMEKSLSDAPNRNLNELKEFDKKNESRLKKNTNDLIKTYANKSGVLKKSTPMANTTTKEKMSLISSRLTSGNRISAQNELRKEKQTRFASRYDNIPKLIDECDTRKEKFPGRLYTGLKLPTSVGMSKERKLQMRPKYSYATKLETLEDDDEELKESADITDSLTYEPKTTTVLFENREMLSKEPPKHKEKSPGDHGTTTDFAKSDTRDNLPLKDIEETKDIAIDETCMNSMERENLKETNILDALIADIEDIEEDLYMVRGEKSSSALLIDVPKEALPREPILSTNKEKLPRISKETWAPITADSIKEKYTKPSQKRNSISILQPKERQIKDVKKLEKPKVKDLLPKSKDNIPKCIKTKFDFFKKQNEQIEQQLQELNARKNALALNFSQEADTVVMQNPVNAPKEMKFESSGSSIKSLLPKSSDFLVNTSTETFSKTSISRLSELKLSPQKVPRLRFYH